MTDQKLKVEMIRSIEELQLPNELIDALNDAKLTENVSTALTYLKNITQQWH
ncbi:hypothetical protein RFI02_19160 [Acinetobacter sichuanensis]|uniref:hypothetical protein n=1 Tax=Acinetobacter sichuanensis TaxID=2136183 RepID=UPI00280DA7F8|nr:hypothetical protein [Acinetobacter sichuanensis]MDQ9023222.1 hypothetical protein [Acinetobacter sichuanensis]